MAVLIIGGGLVGSQIARLLVAAGERPVIMDRAAQPQALADYLARGLAPAPSSKGGT